MDGEGDEVEFVWVIGGEGWDGMKLADGGEELDCEGKIWEERRVGLGYLCEIQESWASRWDWAICTRSKSLCRSATHVVRRTSGLGILSNARGGVGVSLAARAQGLRLLISSHLFFSHTSISFSISDAGDQQDKKLGFGAACMYSQYEINPIPSHPIPFKSPPSSYPSEAYLTSSHHVGVTCGFQLRSIS